MRYPFHRRISRARARAPMSASFGLALVVQLLAAAERDLDLGAALFVEIELERHDRHAFPLDRAGSLLICALMQQQLARPLRRMIEARWPADIPGYWR